MPGQSRRSQLSEVLGMATNLAVIAVALSILLRPNASLRTWWAERQERIATHRTISSTWPELTGEGARTGLSLDAPFTIVAFGDYQCPFCRSAEGALKSLLADHPDVTLVYRHMPLSDIHPMAESAARASICAERDGFFQEMHAFLYQKDDWLNGPDWADIAQAMGATDPVAFVKCLSSNETQARLARDRALSEQLGLHATPSFVGRKGVHQGTLDGEALKRILGEATR